MSTLVTAFLPCRAGSSRVPRKNTRQFGPFKHGLIEIKLTQLLACNSIDTVVLSSNDNTIIDYAKSLGNPKLSIHLRDNSLCTSATSTDSLITHANNIIKKSHILWTHVTSPFVTSDIYSDIIERYFHSLEYGHDSLMTVTPLHSFLWNELGPINYNRSTEKWPRTQTLTPINEVNSAAFIASSDIYSQYADRIGNKPFLYPLNKLIGFDIDWEEDFTIAEHLLSFLNPYQ